MHALRGVNTICITSLKLHFSALSHRDYLKFVLYNPIALLQTGEFPKDVKNAILKKNPLLSFDHTERSQINIHIGMPAYKAYFLQSNDRFCSYSYIGNKSASL